MTRSIAICLATLIGMWVVPQEQPPAASDQPSRQRAMFALQQLPDQIKKMDEPTMRLLLRVRLANFLWVRKQDLWPSAPADAEALVVDAVEDYKAHEKEIPDLYGSRLRAELIALLQQRAPDLLNRLAEKYDFLLGDKRDQLRGAQMMLGDKDGIKPALDLARSILSSGQDPGASLLLFLERLRQEKPAELPGLLTALLSAEEQNPGTISVNTLYVINAYYLKEENPLELKTRFLAAAVNAIERSKAVADGQPMLAYRLMNIISPSIAKLAPSLYARSSALTSAVAARLPQTVLDRIAAENRISQSQDKLNQLIVEAHSTENESFKDDLLSQAAELALTKKQARMAADLAMQTSTNGDLAMWRDQFLADVTRQALESKDPSLAEETANKIKSPLDRAPVLQKIALYLFASKDIARSRELLNEASKLIASAENNPQKARHLLLLAITCLKVDEIRVTEITQAAINVINNIPKPSPGEKPNSEQYKAYAQSLTLMAWNVIPAFQSIVLSDEMGTFSLASGIQNKEIRASAIFGASVGILQAIKSGDSKSQANKEAKQ